MTLLGQASLPMWRCGLVQTLLREAEHLACDHRTGILVLSGDQVAVHDPVIRKDVRDAVAGLVQRALAAEFGLRMLRRW